MEARFFILLNNLEPALRNELELNLSAEKAVFVDEVNAEWQALYLALEYVELPCSIIKPQADMLILGWEVNFDPEEFTALVQPFLSVNLTVAVMLVSLEDGSGVRVHTLDPELDDSALTPIAEPLINDAAIASWMQQVALQAVERPEGRVIDF